MLSIVTSLYKSDKYLPKFSGKLLQFAEGLKNLQVNFELIGIANDPSEAEKKFAKDFEKFSWFKFVGIGREPLYATWNRGMNLAKGDVVGFWNVDDVRYPQAIQEALKLIEQGAELVYFPFIIKRYLKIATLYMPLPGQLIDKQMPQFKAQTKEIFTNSMVCGPFFLFTKKLYQMVGPFDEQFKIAGDFDWCARAAKVTDKFRKAKVVAGEFRVDGGGLSAGGSPRQTAENNVVYIRSHAWNKMQIAEDPIIKQYRTKHILYREKLLPLN